MDENEALDVATGGRCAGRAAGHHPRCPVGAGAGGRLAFPDHVATPRPATRRPPGRVCPTGFWIKAIAVVVWLAWVQVIIAVGAEVVARVRGRSSDRRRGLGWAQAVAGRLVGALAVAGGLVGSAPHAVAAPAPSLASTLVAVAGPPLAAPSAMVPVAVAVPLQHVVVRGEFVVVHRSGRARPGRGLADPLGGQPGACLRRAGL